MPYSIPPTEGPSPLNLQLNRPRDQRFLLRQASSNRTLNATVKENMGSGTYRISINGETIQVKLPGDKNLNVGDRLRLRITSDEDGLHLQLLRRFSGSRSISGSGESSTVNLSATARSLTEILNELSLDDTPTNRNIIKSMIRFQLPINENTFQKISSVARDGSLLQKASEQQIIRIASLLEASNLSYNRDMISFFSDVLSDSTGGSYDSVSQTSQKLQPLTQTSPGTGSEFAFEVPEPIRENIRSLFNQILRDNSPDLRESMKLFRDPENTSSLLRANGRAMRTALNSLPTEFRDSLQHFAGQITRTIGEFMSGNRMDPGKSILNSPEFRELSRQLPNEQTQQLRSNIREIATHLTSSESGTSSTAETAVQQTLNSVREQVNNRFPAASGRLHESALSHLNKLLTSLQAETSATHQDTSRIEQALKHLVREGFRTRIPVPPGESARNITPSNSEISTHLQEALDHYLKSNAPYRLLDNLINRLIELAEIEHGSKSGGTGTASEGKVISIDSVINQIQELLNRLDSEESSFGEINREGIELLKNTDPSIRNQLLARLEQLEKQKIQQDGVARELIQLLKQSSKVESSSGALRMLELMQSRPGREVIWVRLPAGEILEDPGFLRFEIDRSRQAHTRKQEEEGDDGSETSTNKQKTTVGIQLTLSRVGKITGKVELTGDNLLVSFEVRDESVREHFDEQLDSLTESLNRIDPDLNVSVQFSTWEAEPTPDDLLVPWRDAPGETRKIDLKA